MPRQYQSISDITSASLGLGPLLKNASGENKQWMGVGAMRAGNTTCTVNLIEPPGSCALSDDTPAMIITNGHCVDLKDASVKRNSTFDADISFNHFQDSAQQQVSAKAHKIVYANMATKDLAILTLNMTYGDLKKKGITPFRISKKFESGKVKNVAVPTDGVPKEQQYIRGNSCSTGPRKDILEGNYIWKSQVSLDCPAVGGSSGSGIFNEATGELMGLLNTANNDKPEDPYTPCRYNGPCEFDSKGINHSENTRYGYDLEFLSSCTTSTCEINPELSTCPLPSSSQVMPLVSTPTNDLNRSFSLENTAFEKRFQAYRVKIGPASSTDCADPSGYMETKSTRYTPLKENYAEGAYVVCSYGQDLNGQWQKPKDASLRGVRVDKTPPVSKISKSKEGDELRIESQDLKDPLQGSQYKYAKKASDCQTDTGYVNPPIQWKNKRIPINKAKGSHICVMAIDIAGNTEKSPTAYPLK